MNHEATELPGESSNQAHERMRDSSSTVTRQADFLDLISDDGASVQGANLDMPPAYGNHPQEINIDRDGFQASAANACKRVNIILAQVNMARLSFCR